MKKLLSLTLAICLTSSSFALEWQMVGARQSAMGGAGVAIAQGSDAQYYNPALLAKDSDEYDSSNQLDFTFGVQTKISPVLEATRKLMRMSEEYKRLTRNIEVGGDPIDCKDMNAWINSFANINDMLKSDAHSVINANVGVGFKKGGFSVSLRSLSSLSSLPVPDKKNILLGQYGTYDGIEISSDTSVPSGWGQDIDRISNAITEQGIRKDLQKLFGLPTSYSAQDIAAVLVNSLLEDMSSDQNTVSKTIDNLVDNMPQIAEMIKGVFSASDVGSYVDNTTHIQTDLGIFTEASLGYGFNLLRGISLGGNLKVIEGTISQAKINIVNNDLGLGGLAKEIWYDKKFSTNVGVDLGAAINFSELFQGDFIFDPTIAVVGKNLNNPKFKRKSGPDYELERQFRLGAAIHPFTNRLTIAADIDLNENKDFSEKYKSRQLAGGIEYLVVNRHSFKVPVRLGVNKNIADNNAPVYFTAGFGTMNTEYSFEMALSVGDGTEKINGNRFPNTMGLSMTFAWMF